MLKVEHGGTKKKNVDKTIFGNIKNFLCQIHLRTNKGKKFLRVYHNIIDKCGKARILISIFFLEER